MADTFLGRSCPSGPHDGDGCIRYKNGHACVILARNRVRKWESDNPERKRANILATRRKVCDPVAKHPLYIRACERWWKRVGILEPDGSGILTWKTYEQTFKIQKGRCAVCEKVLDVSKKRDVCADHDHKTGLFRGVLCAKCNDLVARAENPLLTKAEEYLLRTKELI
jgi:phage FluMu protein Com